MKKTFYNLSAIHTDTQFDYLPVFVFGGTKRKIYNFMRMPLSHCFL